MRIQQETDPYIITKLEINVGLVALGQNAILHLSLMHLQVRGHSHLPGGRGVVVGGGGKFTMTAESPQ